MKKRWKRVAKAGHVMHGEVQLVRGFRIETIQYFMALVHIYDTFCVSYFRFQS
jgi:hypothetical protein